MHKQWHVVGNFFWEVTDRVVENEFISSPVELVVGANFFWQKPQVSHCLFIYVVRIKSTQKSKWACKCSRKHTNTRTSRTPEQRRVLSSDVSCGSRSTSFNCSIPYLAVFYFCMSMGESSVRTTVYRERDQRGSKCIEREMKETKNWDERPRRRKTSTNALYSNLFNEKFPRRNDNTIEIQSHFALLQRVFYRKAQVSDDSHILEHKSVVGT